jgi:hypothetical protein
VASLEAVVPLEALRPLGALLLAALSVADQVSTLVLVLLPLLLVVVTFLVPGEEEAREGEEKDNFFTESPSTTSCGCSPFFGGRSPYRLNSELCAIFLVDSARRIGCPVNAKCTFGLTISD